MNTQTFADEEFFAEEMTTALVAPMDNAVVQPVDPSDMDWLYQTTRRLSIDNKTRRGFIDKGDDRLIEELRCQIVGAVPLYSHRQPGPDEQKPRHADTLEWCGSRDGHARSTRGMDCTRCPAFSDCSWKIELTVLAPNSDGELTEYLLTIPTASSVRFRQVAQQLFRKTKRQVASVEWRAWVTIEEDEKNRRVYPVANFEPLELDGTPMLPKEENGNAQHSGKEISKASGKLPTVKTGKWQQVIEKAIAAGYVERDEKAGFRLLNVVKGVGIGEITDANLSAAWNAIEAHYQSKQSGK